MITKEVKTNLTPPFKWAGKHEGARHCRKPLGRRKGFNISINAGFTKSRAFEGKCGQKISTSVGFTKIRAFEGKCGQKTSTTVFVSESLIIIIISESWLCCC